MKIVASHQYLRALSFTITFLLIGLTGCDSFTDVTPVPTVNPERLILFHNGDVLTMYPDRPQVEAIAIGGETILAVGSNEEILALDRPGATVIDLEGATIMPGFVDAHSHLFNDAEQYFDMNLAEVQRLGLENGITTLGDLYVTEGFLKEMQAFEAAGGLRIRTSLYLVATDNCGRLQGDWWQDYDTTDESGEMLRIAGVKIFTDGGTCERPALSYELQPGEGLGDLFHSQEELNELVAKIEAAGRQAAIHAIGDRAVEQAQNAIESALNGRPNDNRHRIEHNSVIRPDLLLRYGEIGIIPVVFALYPVCNPYGPPPPEEYQTWEWPWPALIEANPGLPVAWHGDDPWVGQVRPLDDLYGFVTRNDIGEDGSICPAPNWQKQHTISVEQALQMMTINAAYALFREDEVGSLEVGKYADLIILSHNPLAVEAERLRETAVWLTMVGGQTTYCTPEQENLCP